MNWIRNKKMRAKVGSDLLLYGNAFVAENDDGTHPIRLPPYKLSVLIDKKPTPGLSEQMPKIIGYQVNFLGGPVIYKPDHVWHGRLEHVRH